MIGWSWIFLTGAWIERAGTIGSLLAIFGGGTLMLIIAMVYAELAAMFPKNGGEHVYRVYIVPIESRCWPVLGGACRTSIEY